MTDLSRISDVTKIKGKRPFIPNTWWHSWPGNASSRGKNGPGSLGSLQAINQRKRFQLELFWPQNPLLGKEPRASNSTAQASDQTRRFCCQKIIAIAKQHKSGLRSLIFVLIIRSAVLSNLQMQSSHLLNCPTQTSPLKRNTARGESTHASGFLLFVRARDRPT